MAKAGAHLGFGDTWQVAKRFELTRAEVMRRARSGEWPSWIIHGRRVFDLDAIARIQEQQANGQEAAR